MGTAKSKTEAKAEQAALQIAEQRAAEVKAAEGAVMKAGYILGQVHERVSKGLYHLDDVHALAAVANAVLVAQTRLLTVLKSFEVAPATAAQLAQETGQAQESGLIITG